MAALDERSDESADPTLALQPPPYRPLDPLWKRIIDRAVLRLALPAHAESAAGPKPSSRSWRCTQDADRAGSPFRRPARSRGLERARVLVSGRRRACSIAPELRVPVGVRAIAVDGVTPALALDPFAMAARFSPTWCKSKSLRMDGTSQSPAARRCRITSTLVTPAGGWPRTCRMCTLRPASLRVGGQ